MQLRECSSAYELPAPQDARPYTQMRKDMKKAHNIHFFLDKLLQGVTFKEIYMNDICFCAPRHNMVNVILLSEESSNANISLITQYRTLAKNLLGKNA